MTTTGATMLSFVLLVLEWSAGEGASAASAEISQRLYTQRAHSPLGILQTRDNSIQHNTVNWILGKCPKILFVSREEWHAEESKNMSYLNVNGGVGLVFYHHTEGPECNSTDSCAQITRHWQKYHQETKGWDDIAYNFLIGGDGQVYEGRGFDRIGAHTLGYNTKSVSFGFVGNFTFHVPNNGMLAAAADLILCGIKLGKLRVGYTLHGQRDANHRDCPGDAFYALIQKDPHFGGRLHPYIYTPPQR